MMATPNSSSSSEGDTSSSVEDAAFDVSLAAPIIIAIAGLLGVLASVVIVQRVARKWIIMGSAAGTAIALLALGAMDVLSGDWDATNVRCIWLHVRSRYNHNEHGVSSVKRKRGKWWPKETIDSWGGGPLTMSVRHFKIVEQNIKSRVQSRAF